MVGGMRWMRRNGMGKNAIRIANFRFHMQSHVHY